MATTTTSRKRTAESRAESGDAAVNTTLFVVGCTPYKETILLPRVETRITTSSVVQAIADQQAKPLLSPLPRGYFMVINYMDGVQVALFRCRSTNSSQHSQLPVPSRRHRAAEGFACEPRFRVGFEYIYMVFPRLRSCGWQSGSSTLVTDE